MAKRISKFLPSIMDSDNPKLNPENFYQVKRYEGKLLYYARIKDNHYWFIAENNKDGKDRAREYMLNSALSPELNFSGKDMRDLIRVSRRLK